MSRIGVRFGSDCSAEGNELMSVLSANQILAALRFGPPYIRATLRSGHWGCRGSRRGGGGFALHRGIQAAHERVGIEHDRRRERRDAIAEQGEEVNGGRR